MLWLCFELPSCLFGNTRDTFIMHEKAKFVCFIYMQSQKVKFKYVQINMKQVSYIRQISRLYAFDSVLCFLYIKHIKLRAGSVLAHKQ